MFQNCQGVSKFSRNDHFLKKLFTFTKRKVEILFTLLKKCSHVQKSVTVEKYVQDLNNVNNFENVLFLNNIEFQNLFTMFKKCWNFETFCQNSTPFKNGQFLDISAANYSRRIFISDGYWEHFISARSGVRFPSRYFSYFCYSTSVASHRA